MHPPAGSVVFLGSKRLGLRILETMAALRGHVLAGAITIDDRADRRSVHDQFVDRCRELHIPLYVAENRQVAEAMIAGMAPDLCIVAGWYWLIGPALLRSVPRGFIGIHNSLLPRYRGGAPLVWALMNGETEVGFSLFSFTEAMDAGPIWASGSVAVDTSDTVGTVLDRLEPLAIATFERHYAGILDGSAAAAAQLEADATFCCQRCAADGRIDWTAPARSVHDFIRAQSDPYPGAYGYLDGERVTVWRSRPFGATWHGSPGQIAWRDEGGVYVVCGDSRCVILDEAETRAGRAPAAALIRSTRPRFAAAQVDAGKEAPQ